ncbi:Hypothetical protein NTJ_07939 [Nesidiocoris tenuis]|uniref:Uncharacterized protein n=1 Tax=Nesidiocoris tenuis TaxID=355587 RepID=A0ABN7AW12_9HEMI|nr:Hypothetical protein NTJ_07939 [Nesidiocoris tenuis]
MTGVTLPPPARLGRPLPGAAPFAPAVDSRGCSILHLRSLVVPDSPAPGAGADATSGTHSISMKRSLGDPLCERRGQFAGWIF